MEKKFFDTLKAKKYSAYWCCSDCSEEPKQLYSANDISKIISEMKNELKSELCNEMKKDINELSSLIQNKLDKLAKDDVLANEVFDSEENSTKDVIDKNTKQSTTHTIVISSNDAGSDGDNGGNFTAESWSEVVKNNILPKLKNVPVSKATRSKDGKGVLIFPTKESRNIAALNLKETCTIKTQDRELKTLYPKLKIGWISKSCFNELNKTSLKDSIITKNPSIKELIEKEDKMLDIIFINDEKDVDYSYAVIKTDPEVKDAIFAQGHRLYIGLSSCKVTERYHILQCYQCQQFGHKKGSDLCTLNGVEKEICLYCSDEHRSKTCPLKVKGKVISVEHLKCNNCQISKNPSIRSNCVGHTTTSYSCPVFQNALKNTMNRTLGSKYRPDLPKNQIRT